MQSPIAMVAALAVCAPFVAGQSIVRVFETTQPGYTGFGTAIAGAIDIDNDGFDDVFIGSPEEYVNGVFRVGRARVFSGADGSVLHVVEGSEEGQWYGAAVTGIDDVNGDGHDDFAVGAPGRHHSSQVLGRVDVFSGFDGSLLWSRQGPDGSEFGYALAPAADLDGDGVSDLIVGSPNGRTRGLAYVLSGGDGSLIYSFSPANTPHAGTRFGSDVCGGGDHNGDGTRDIIVVSGGIFVHAFSGVDGSRLYRIDLDRIGAGSLSWLGDVNGDGCDEILVGAHGTPPASRGAVLALSGLDGSVLYERFGASAMDFLGFSVSRIDDIDHDGLDDAAVAVPGRGAGAVRLISGATGAKLAALVGGETGTPAFAYAVADGGDVNADGVPDLLISMPSFYAGETVRAVRVTVNNYCSPATYNSSGFRARISMEGSSVIADDDFGLHARKLPTNQLGYFLVAQGTGFVNPVGSQGNLCLSSPLGRFTAQAQDSGSEGVITAAVDLANIPMFGAALSGSTFFFQAWYRDVNPMPTSNFSDGLAVTFE